jgi:hypothetical protein
MPAGPADRILVGADTAEAEDSTCRATQDERRRLMDSRAVLSESQRYWLAHSEGFRVDSDGGRIGIVESVIGGDPHEAVALIVRAGLLGTRLVVVPAEEVVSVASRRKRLRLRPSPEVGTCSFLRDIAGRARRARPTGTAASQGR